jgi:hypothetical protein
VVELEIGNAVEPRIHHSVFLIGSGFTGYRQIFFIPPLSAIIKSQHLTLAKTFFSLFHKNTTSNLLPLTSPLPDLCPQTLLPLVN